MDQRLADAGLLQFSPAGDNAHNQLGQVVVPWFGEPVHADVIFEFDEPDQSPNELQIEAFCRFMADRDAFFSDLERLLFDYYTEARADCDLDAKTKESLFPLIDDPRQLSSMTRLTGIVIGYFDGDDWSAVIGLLAECSWEREHGLGVKVIDGRVAEIGFQDVVV